MVVPNAVLTKRRRPTKTLPGMWKVKLRPPQRFTSSAGAVLFALTAWPASALP
jgi:hypothetical protein